MEYVKLSTIAKELPGRPSTICVWRWCRHGLVSRDGSRVRLPHIRVGRSLMVTREDCDAFFWAVAEADALHFKDGGACRRVTLVKANSKSAQDAHERLKAQGM